MKRLMSLLLAIIMILGPAAEVVGARSLSSGPRKSIQDQDLGSDRGSMMPMSIAPGGPRILSRNVALDTTKRHTFQFYTSEEDAKAAQTGDDTVTPFDTKYLRTDGWMEQIELVEQKDELFEGWFYKDENGKEKPVPFGKQGWIDEDKTFYAYPKREDVIAVFFAHGSSVVKSSTPDDNGFVSIDDQPGVGEPGKVLAGWSTDPKYTTVAEAEAAGALFNFKEQANPTAVEGSLMLHALFEDAIRISYDTHGSSVVAGENIESMQDVRVPEEITREGYRFQYWYVLEEDDDSVDGVKEVELKKKTVYGIEYFNYKFTKDTVIHAKWLGVKVPFNIVFMREKRPDQIQDGGEKYEFLGTFKNEDDTNLQITKGISGSTIVYNNQDQDKGLDEITNLDPNQFTSYLITDNPTQNLLKYAELMDVDPELLKGFHVNEAKTNEEQTVISGDGLTTKIVYLDRDTVNLRVYHGFGEGSLLEDERQNPDALGNFKYGQILQGEGNKRGYKYITSKYGTEGNTYYLIFNRDDEVAFSSIPFANEKVGEGEKEAYYLKREGGAWVFTFHRVSYNFNKKLISIPFKLPADSQDLSYNEAIDWIGNENIEVLRKHLLPNEDQPLITEMLGVWAGIPLQPEDYPLIDGYEVINKPETYATTNQDVIDKALEFAGVTETDYMIMPIVYKKQNFALQFNSGATNQDSQRIRDIPYYSTIVGPAGSEGGDPNLEDKEKAVKDYMAKFVKAEIDPVTKEVTNLEKVTKNQDGHLFMGWYLDPGYTIEFDEHMPMPAYNLQVFAKWEPLYHYVQVHHLPAGTSGVDRPENITELKIAHGKFIDTQEDILKNPPIPSGRSKSDFQGWETYGDVQTEVPSPSGTGGSFLAKFDQPVNTAFHLYPRWDSNKVGVVYAFNCNESNRPLSETDVKDIMDSLDSPGTLTKENNYYMSDYQYLLDSEVRLRAPLGSDDTGKIKEPVAPEGTSAYGKVFLGWKIMYRDKERPYNWTTVGDLVYYNSEIRFTENNISHKSGAKKGDAVGVMVLVAQWGEKKMETSLTLHRNYDKEDKEAKKIAIKRLNFGRNLPDLEKDEDLEGLEISSWKREKFQFLGWSENPDGSGKTYKAGDKIFVDEQHEEKLNHLYAQWQKYYTLEAEKVWAPNESDYTFKMGLIRRTAPSTTTNPSFESLGGFKSVPGSLKTYKTDLDPDGKMRWEVPGLDENGDRYSYIIVEVTPEMEDKFKNFVAWEDLNVAVDQTWKAKLQVIGLTNSNNEVDTFTSATARTDKRDGSDRIIGYNFTVTNTKVVVPMPIITQPYADQTEILITPGKDVGDQVKQIEVTLPDDTELVLTRDNDDNFTISDNDQYVVTADPTGKLTIKLPEGKVLAKGEIIKAVAKNAGEVASEKDQKEVLGAQDSFKIEKPVQKKRDQEYNVVIEASVPSGTKVQKDTVFTLMDEHGNAIMDGDKKILGTLDELGKTVVFTVPDKILIDGQTVKVQTQEPKKQPILSDLSELLDINAPDIKANNITGVVGNALPANDTNVVTVGDKDLTNVELDYKLPADLKLEKDDNASTNAKITWKVTGAGKYIITSDDNHQVTYTATDRFGNKSEVTITVVISDKELVDQPTIDDIAKGDTSVKITPPSDGDRLVVNFPNGEVSLEKDKEGNWTDGTNTYTPDENTGKIDVKTPDGKPLDVSDIVTAQGKDSTGDLADSPVVKKSVALSTKITPSPQFSEVKVGDTSFKIKPVDQETEGIVTDKLVITIKDNNEDREESEKQEKTITLTKGIDGKWSDGTNKYDEGEDGYITVALEGLKLTDKHSFGATGEDTFHGHIISIPTSINVNAEQSKVPKTAEQGPTNPNGNPTIIGKGEPGADINVYDPITKDLIAGPVKVDKDGNYTIELPKDSIPNDGIVDVKQKEDGKPESEAKKVDIDTSAPAAPEIDQPSVGDKTVKVKVPAEAEKMTITLPDGSTVELKKENGKWTDGTDTYTPDQDGKIELPVDPALKNNDKITATAEDEFGNKSEEAEAIVGKDKSFGATTPVQKPRNDKNEVVVESAIPAGSNPADGTTYTLVGEDGNPIKDNNGQDITATPDKDGKLNFNVPDGILKDGLTVGVQVKEPGKTATTTEPSEALDLTGPVIKANDITGKVGVAIEKATISTNEPADIRVSPNLPNSLVLRNENSIRTSWEISGKGEFVTTTKHTIVAVDKFGNKTEETFTVTITTKDVIKAPKLDDIAKGDKTVKVTPPTNGDTLEATFPNGTVVKLTKNTEGNWFDEKGNAVTKDGDKLVIPTPEGKPLDVSDKVTAQGKDSKNILADSSIAEKIVAPSTKKTPSPQFSEIKVGDTSFKIKPVDDADITIITDKLVITIREEGNEVKKITLIKNADGNWVDAEDSTKVYTPDAEGYLTIGLDKLEPTTKHSFGATGEDTFHGHAISDPSSINVNAEQSKAPSAEQGPTTAEGNPTITGKGEPGADISVYDKDGKLIAGPVKVDPQGKYEVELPKDSVPADGKVDVKQKEDGKPESEPTEVTIDTSAPDKPEIDQPSVGDTTVKVTPPADADKITITLPDGSTVELTKDENGNWIDGEKEYPLEGGKVTIPVDTPLKNNDVITATAEDEFGNKSPEASVTVGDKDSFGATTPEQKPRNDKNEVVIESSIPEGSNPADGTTYTLVDESGNPVKDNEGNPITATPDENGKLVFNVPDGILADGDKVGVKVEEPGKEATITEISDPLDLLGPEITAENISGKVGLDVTGEISTNEFANITVRPDLQNALELGSPTDGNMKWSISGKGAFVKTTEHTVVAVDKFGNKTEAKFTVTITDKDLVDAPKIDDIAKGDTTVKVTPPTNGDTLVVTFPDGTKVTLKKDENGVWKDRENPEKDYPLTDGKLVIDTPNGEPLNVSDKVTAQGKDSKNILADSSIAEKIVAQSIKKTPSPQFSRITVGDTSFKIKPVDKEADGVVTDKLVITIRNEEGTEVKKITLTKKADGDWTDGTSEYTPDGEGYLSVGLDGFEPTTKHSFGATGEDTFHGHAISDPSSINVNAEQSEVPSAIQGPTTDQGNPTITGEGVPGADINVYDPETGDLIAGPVKVDKDGNYEVELPKDSVPADGKVDVKQKEDGKPESQATPVTIDTTAPAAPTIDQPSVGDTSVKIKVPADADKMTITLPDGTKVELKKENGNWTDGQKDYPLVDGKVTIPVDAPLQNNDVITAIAEDEFGNQSPEDTKKVSRDKSFSATTPDQKPRNDKNEVVIESSIPEGSNPADGTTYTLVDESGNPIKDNEGNPITATPDENGKLVFNVPDGILADGDKVGVKVEELNKTPSITELSDPLDLVGPVITANDITGKVGNPIEESTISTNEAADLRLSPDLPNSLVLGDANTEKTEWKINGKGEFVTETTHTVVAVDKFGNKTETTFKITITAKDLVDSPTIDPIKEGDKSVKVTPPTKGDTLVVTFPGNKTVTLTKDDEGNWADENGNKYPLIDGKLEISVPNNGSLKAYDQVRAQGKDSTGELAPSTTTTEVAKEEPKPTPTPTPSPGPRPDSGKPDSGKPDSEKPDPVDPDQDPTGPQDGSVEVERIHGKDRYETAIEISKQTFDKSEIVVLAAGRSYPDSLVASVLAAKLDAPLLLVEKDRIPASVMAEIIRLGAKKVYIAGGGNTIAMTVEEGLIADGYDTLRLFGKDRYETSEEIAKHLITVLGASKEQLIFADGKQFADALSISPYAGKTLSPILLVNQDLSAYAKTLLAQASKAIISGGSNSVSSLVEKEIRALVVDTERVSGPDRYATSEAIRLRFYKDATVATVASGEVYPDALTGSVLSIKKDAPMLLVRQTGPTQAQLMAIKDSKITKIYVFGGSKTIAASAAQAFAQIQR